MRRIKRLASIVLSLTLFLTPVSFGTEGGGQSVKMFAVNVGKGDAIILQVDGYTCLIDAGKEHARGNILSAMKYLGVDGFDGVFLTHTDDDHGDGLKWISESDSPVKTWYASAMYTDVKEGKHPAEKAAKARNAEVVWLRRGDRIPMGDTGAVLDVLAPSRLYTDKDDNNSLVMMLESAQGRILLTGDMELAQEAELLSFGDDLRCAVLKVPNHADDDTTGSGLVKAASAQLAVISTSTEEKPETPDPGVIRRLEAAGTECVVTQEAGLGLLITLENGRAACERVDIPASASKVSLREVVAGDDIIVLKNEESAHLDMTGWYLFSDKGGETYFFPDGFTLEGGATLIIGTESSEDEDYHLLWNEKKVIHKSKTDVITLYDAQGYIVDSLSNGY